MTKRISYEEGQKKDAEKMSKCEHSFPPPAWSKKMSKCENPFPNSRCPQTPTFLRVMWYRGRYYSGLRRIEHVYCIKCNLPADEEVTVTWQSILMGIEKGWGKIHRTGGLIVDGRVR